MRPYPRVDPHYRVVKSTFQSTVSLFPFANTSLFSIEFQNKRPLSVQKYLQLL